MKVCRSSSHDIHHDQERAVLKVADAFRGERLASRARISVPGADQLNRAHGDTARRGGDDDFDSVSRRASGPGTEFLHYEWSRNNLRKGIGYASRPVRKERLPRVVRVKRLVKVIQERHSCTLSVS